MNLELVGTYRGLEAIVVCLATLMAREAFPFSLGPPRT